MLCQAFDERRAKSEDRPGVIAIRKKEIVATVLTFFDVARMRWAREHGTVGCVRDNHVI
jgi:hypothetical protein